MADLGRSAKQPIYMKYGSAISIAILTFALGYIAGSRYGAIRPRACLTSQEARFALKPGNVGDTKLPSENATIPIESERVSTATRLKVLASLGKQSNMAGFGYHCAPITWDPNKVLSDEFIFVFGLNADEVARLSEALRAARSSISEIQRATMTVQFDPDKKALSLNIPATPDKSSLVYDQALSAMNAVMGPERMQYFNMFSADAFDSAFNQFALSSVNITITPVPSPKGEPLYMVNAVQTMPGGGNSSTSGSGLGKEWLEKSYPLAVGLIDKFFPKK